MRCRVGSVALLFAACSFGCGSGEGASGSGGATAPAPIAEQPFDAGVGEGPGTVIGAGGAASSSRGSTGGAAAGPGIPPFAEAGAAGQSANPPGCFRVPMLYEAVATSIVGRSENVACETDADCVRLFVTNACSACAYFPVAANRAPAVLQALTREAQEDCGYCPVAAVDCGLATTPGTCNGGSCAEPSFVGLK